MQMVDTRPILGVGPGNYTAPDALHILDNQYLGSLVTLGIVGIVATLAYFLLPGIAGVLAARAAAHPALRSLAGAVAAGTLVAAVCSSTFDSLSFPVFALALPRARRSRRRCVANGAPRSRSEGRRECCDSEGAPECSRARSDDEGGFLMDPTAVLKSVWRYRWYVLPAVLITIGVALFMFALGPRTYESTVSYALVNPDVPTEADIERDPALAQLNGDNPYLRSTDPNLVANVVITRLNAAATGEYLEGVGLSSDYEVSPGVGGSGFIVQITAVGSSRAQSLETSKALGGMFESELLAIQSVNGADARFLFTSIVVAQPDRAAEQFSSRLRSVIIVLIGGVILVFGAVSLGRGIDAARARRKVRADAAAEAAAAADLRVEPSDAQLDDPVEERAPARSVAGFSPVALGRGLRTTAGDEQDRGEERHPHPGVEVRADELPVEDVEEPAEEPHVEDVEEPAEEPHVEDVEEPAEEPHVEDVEEPARVARRRRGRAC